MNTAPSGSWSARTQVSETGMRSSDTPHWSGLDFNAPPSASEDGESGCAPFQLRCIRASLYIQRGRGEAL